MITIKHKEGEITCDIRKIDWIGKIDGYQDVLLGESHPELYYFKLNCFEKTYSLTWDQYDDLLELVRQHNASE